MLAAIILKDLFNRAHVSYIPECIQPILTYDNKKKINISLYIFVVSYLDDHEKWIPVVFPKYIFSEIMHSIKVFSFQ